VLNFWTLVMLSAIAAGAANYMVAYWWSRLGHVFSRQNVFFAFTALFAVLVFWLASGDSWILVIGQKATEAGQPLEYMWVAGFITGVLMEKGYQLGRQGERNDRTRSTDS
jgi:hypothetical protein